MMIWLIGLSLYKLLSFCFKVTDTPAEQMYQKLLSETRDVIDRYVSVFYHKYIFIMHPCLETGHYVEACPSAYNSLSGLLLPHWKIFLQNLLFMITSIWHCGYHERRGEEVTLCKFLIHVVVPHGTCGNFNHVFLLSLYIQRPSVYIVHIP